MYCCSLIRVVTTEQDKVERDGRFSLNMQRSSARERMNYDHVSERIGAILMTQKKARQHTLVWRAEKIRIWKETRDDERHLQVTESERDALAIPWHLLIRELTEA